MNEKNFDWDDLRLFLAVARAGGLSAAADATGKSAPTLGRRMVTLERRLRQDLFRRNARGYETTEAGEKLVRTAEDLERQISPLLAGVHASMPRVKVSAGTWVTHFLCSKLPKITAKNEISLRFIAADKRLDIGRREAVIGIRNQRPAGVGLAGRKIGQVQFAVYASNGSDLPWARVLGRTPSAQWVQAQAGSRDSIEVTHPRNALDLALYGQARAVLPTFIGDDHEALSRMTPPISELTHDQWLVTHHEDRYLPTVRTVIERIYRVLRVATEAK